MRPITVTVGPLASAVSNNIATSQTTAGAANLTLNGARASGGVATLDLPRRVLITSAGNDSGISFAVTGTDGSGNTQSESVAGTNASSAYTALDYKTVTSIRTSAATSGSGIIAGTNGIASSAWVRVDDFAAAQIAIQATVSGTVNFTIQQTLDDPNDPSNPVAKASTTWVSHPDTNLVSATATVQGNYAYPPRYTRVLLNSGSGTVTATYIQASVVPY